MFDLFLAIQLYFAGLAGGFGFLPMDSPLAPPGPDGPRPAVVERINGIPVSSCGPQW